MDDLEKAILISFDDSGSFGPIVMAQALAYCQSAKESPNVYRICLEKMGSTDVVQVQFWSLQTLQEFFRAKYSILSPDEKSLIRKSVFSMCCFDPIFANKDGTGGDGVSLVESDKISKSPAFIKNKLAQVMATLIYFEYPLVWPSVFVDLLKHLSKGSQVISMFCRILNTLDDELISQDYPRSSEEIAVAGRIKDAMRQQCIEQIVEAWYGIVSTYWKSEPELCADVLDSLRRCVSWIDISLVVNSAFLPLLFELISIDGGSEKLRCSAAGCIFAVISKKMDPQTKFKMLKSFPLSKVFPLIMGDTDSSFVASISALLTGYATEVLECSKRSSPDDCKNLLLESLNEVLPSVFYVMQNREIDSTFSIVQFLSSYVSTLKNILPLNENQLLHIVQILAIIRMQICYDPLYRSNLELLDKIGREEEDKMAEYRKDLFVLLRSIGRVAPDVTQMFIRDSLISAVTSSSERNVEEVEAALSLLYAFGESLTDEAMRSGSSQLTELVPILLSTKFPGHECRLVAFVYVETVARYMKYAQENTQYIPMLLKAFLDERGIHHSNIHIIRRASYQFMRAVKLLKVKLIPYLDKIMENLQDIVNRFTNLNISSNQSSGSEDGSYVFEAIGMLIGMEDVPFEKQIAYLSTLLNSLCHQTESLLVAVGRTSPDDCALNIAALQQVIMAINALSKGFNEKLVTGSRPALGAMFTKTMEVLLRILVVYPKIEPLRIKLISFIHRMVETLGSVVFPYLPKALEHLLTEIEPREMVGFLVLLNQMICKFNSSFHDILDDIFPTVAARAFDLIPRNEFQYGTGSITEEMRELQELQKTVYAFLHVVATHDLSSIFLSPKSRYYLDQMMELLLTTACTHKDIHVRKACVQIFIKLIKDWCARPFREEKLPGFQKFIIELFATQCCLYSVLDKSFAFDDANTLVLFGEIVLAQKVMYEKLGNDFLVHFTNKGFSHCPQEMIEQYCQKLQGNDIKAFKMFYQSLIESLRRQENGDVYR